MSLGRRTVLQKAEDLRRDLDQNATLEEFVLTMIERICDLCTIRDS